MNPLSFTKSLVIGLMALGTLHCGGSPATSGSGDGTPVTTTTQDQTIALLQSTFTATTLSAEQADALASESFEEPLLLQASLNCQAGGTVSVDTDTNTLTLEDCLTEYEDNSLLADGSITISGGESTLTVESDLTVEAEAASGESLSFTEQGTIAITISNPTVTATFDDVTASFEQNGEDPVSVALDGTITFDTTTQLIDGDVEVVFEDVTVTCEFEDFDLETAETEDWLAACEF